MGLFSIFRRKNADDVFHQHAEKIRRQLFPNGHADLALPGLKIKEIMGDRYTQQQCEAYYAAMKTWMEMMPDMTREKAFRKFIGAAEGKISEEEAAEIGLIVQGVDSQLYEVNVGHSPEKAIELNEVIPDQRKKMIVQHLCEMFGQKDRDFFVHRATHVSWRGLSLAAVVVMRPDGRRHRVYFR